MRKLKFLFAFTVCALVAMPFIVFAQDSTATGGIGGIVSKIPIWIPGVILALYEVLVRFVPTSKNYSLLTFLMNIIKFVFPNVSSEAKTVVKTTHD